MTDEEIMEIFKDAGMAIESGANFSAKGQIAQLLNGVKQVVKLCARIADDHKYKTNESPGPYEDACLDVYDAIIAEFNLPKAG